MTAKIRDVARLAGVSPGTVSRVVHNRGYISQTTKAKVSEAIQKLDYRPNAIASRLVSGKTSILGLLVPNLQESYYVEITDAIIETTKNIGYSLLVTTTHGNSSHLTDFLCKGNMDGLLVITPHYIEEELSLITRQEIPCVMINYYAAEGQMFPAVYCDQFKVGYFATQYLIDLGHRHIGFCTSDTNSPSPMKRFQGCLQALTTARLDVKGNHIRDMSQKLQKDPIREIRAWIHEGDLPSAIFVFSDDIALYIMDALKDAGYKIPDDISVVGCGNMLLSTRTIPPLTTIDQHTYEMGIKSVEMLMHMMTAPHETACPVHVIEPQIIIRESCRKSPIS